MEVFTRKLHGRSYRFIKRYCTVCGSEFEAKITDINKGKGNCCSLSCAGTLGATVTNNRIPSKGEHYAYYNNSHEKVRDAKEKGLLNPQPCKICGTEEGVTAHHEDYNKPLEVEWLCHRHHMQLHAQKRKATPTGGLK